MVTGKYIGQDLHQGSTVAGYRQGVTPQSKRHTGVATTISKASTGVKNVGRLAKEKGEVKRAEESVAKLHIEMEGLVEEIDEKISQIVEDFTIDNFAIETFSIKPRRSDIFDLDLCLLWEMVPPMGER